MINFGGLPVDFYVYWCSGITGFRNLEKLEIGTHFFQVRQGWTGLYAALQNMVQTFKENPMTKMKEFKCSTINAFFQDEFLAYLFDIFPNLETFNVSSDLGHQYYSDLDEKDGVRKCSHWRFHNVLPVLRSLGSVKNLTLPSMEMVLAPWRHISDDIAEHDVGVKRLPYVGVHPERTKEK